MNKTWKWILGIMIVLAVTAVIAAPFILHGVLVRGIDRDYNEFRSLDDPWMDERDLDNWDIPMMGNGFPPFGGLFMGLGMLLSLIIPMGLLFAVIYGAVRLAIKHSLPAVISSPAAPMVTYACPKCGRLLKDGWKHCPECGKKQ